MSDSPAQRIRRYLEEQGGETEVPFHNLLTTWGAEAGDTSSRVRMTDDLVAAGVSTDPPLTNLGPGDRVRLRVVGPQERTPLPASPWEGAHPVRDAEQPQAPPAVQPDRAPGGRNVDDERPAERTAAPPARVRRRQGGLVGRLLRRRSNS